MISLEDIKIYLPQYLSQESQEDLFEDLKKFPANLDQRLYTTSLKNKPNLFQGDGLQELLFVNLPDREVRPAPGMILSNSCDIDPANERLFPNRIVYAPIFQIQKYQRMLVREHVEKGKCNIENIDSHIESIKKQFNSHIFYLPKGGELEADSIVFLDRLNNCPADFCDDGKITEKRIFTLSDFGFYAFLVKLSIHFMRVREGVNRTGEEH